MLRLLSRRKAPTTVGIQPPTSKSDFAAASGPSTSTSSPASSEPSGVARAMGDTSCALSTCVAGSRATILEVRCGHADACRLRALGLCEGAAVSVVNSRDCTLLEVRGSRLAVSSAIAAGIMVMPIG